MGEVFAAENIRTGRPVAVKLLRSDSKTKTSAMARFRQEARAAGSINSDHVTQVLDVEDDSEHGVVLVFELLEGESLIDRLKRTGPIPFDELHWIIEQVWMGLADAHRVGIIHRDLKPSNVFLERRPDGTTRVKILDFGISKLPKEMGGETLTEMGQSLGTFSFMPPEQIGKAKTVDHRADIYACATMIYQSLTGQLPYSARNILVMVEMKSKSDARRLAEAMGGPVDPRLEAFIATGLERDPSKRFQTAVEALTAWREMRPAHSPAAADPPLSSPAAAPHVVAPSSRPAAMTMRGFPERTNAPQPAFPPPGGPLEMPQLFPAEPIGDQTTDTAATLAMLSPIAQEKGSPDGKSLHKTSTSSSRPAYAGNKLNAPVTPGAVSARPKPPRSVAPSSLPHGNRPPSNRPPAYQAPEGHPPSQQRLPRADEPNTLDDSDIHGQMAAQPGGGYRPRDVATAFSHHAHTHETGISQLAQPGAPPSNAAQTASSSLSRQPGLPKLFEEATSNPTNSSENATQVFIPRDPQAPPRDARSSPARRSLDPWTLFIGAIAFVLVGSLIVAAILKLLR
jgi:serine/threonine-protein kinase